MKKLLVLAAVCLLAAGCAELEQDLRQIHDYLRKLRGRDPAPPPPAPPAAAELPVAALNLDGNCVGKEETGYAENVRVTVAAGQVRAFDARIDIPKRGSCRYQLADFRQTKQTPFVELLARSNSACALRMWQQGDRITVAATDCEEKCARGAFEYAWPVEFNAAGGCY
jgi:hypothetical protein